MARIPEGYAFIDGPRSKERAEAVLAAAREADVDVALVTTDAQRGGYIAPEKVASAIDASSVKATSAIRDIDENGQPVSVAPSGQDTQEALASATEADPDGTAKKSTTSAKSSTAKSRN